MFSSTLLIGLFVMVQSVFAEVPDRLSPEEQTHHDRLRDAFNTHFYPERVDRPLHLDGVRSPSAKHAHDEADGWRCLTPLVAELKQSWHLFTQVERREMTQSLAPWKVDLVDDVRTTGDPSGPPPPGPCMGDWGSNVLENDHFSGKIFQIP